MEYSVRHNGNSAIVTCKGTGSHWLMTCEDNQWKGDIGNCTVGKQLARQRPLKSLIY